MGERINEPVNVIAVDSGECIMICLPKNTFLVSSKLLKSAPQNQVIYLSLLGWQLSQQRYHIRTLSLTEIPLFLTSGESAINEIKLRQIYSRKYKPE